MSNLNFQSLFGDAELDLDCPNCSHNIPFTMDQVGTIIKCPNCSVEIDLQKSDEYDEVTDSINESLEELDDIFENLND